MTYFVATRSTRFSPYVVRAEHENYGKAKLDQLWRKGEFYDAQIFKERECLRRDLVFTNPLIHSYANPYDRLTELFTQLCEVGTYRVLAARPSRGQNINFYRLFLFSFQRKFGRISFHTHAIELQRTANVLRNFSVRYTGGVPLAAPTFKFDQTEEVIQPLRGARMDGIYIADVADDFRLYFGYAEANATEFTVVFDEFGSTFGINLYDMR